MKIAVIGSGTFNNDDRIHQELNALPATEILTAGSNPVAVAATWYATVKDLPAVNIEAPIAGVGTKAKKMRDRKLVEACDVLLVFWDGRSSNVSEAIEYAHELRKRVVAVPC